MSILRDVGGRLRDAFSALPLLPTTSSASALYPPSSPEPSYIPILSPFSTSPTRHNTYDHDQDRDHAQVQPDPRRSLRSPTSYPSRVRVLMILFPVCLLFFVLGPLSRIESSPLLPRAECSLTTWGGLGVGHAQGGACRYTLRYGKADRWGESSLSLDIGNRTSQLPPSCPQPEGTYVSGTEQSEDCLYATVYTPENLSVFSSLPIFVWLHGGSFVQGSASAPGLDGSKLAPTGNMIVVVLQYRLGVFGYLSPPSAASWSDPNLGVRDVILALRTIRDYARFVGGDRGKVTIGGQSSGATMIRALLGAPAAQGLFRAAILQSDPSSYGLASNQITTKLRDAFYAQDPLEGCTSLDCLRKIPAASIVAAQSVLMASAPFAIPGVPMSMPIRPTFENPTIPSDPTVKLFTSPSSLSNPSIALLLTTVANEAGSALQGVIAAPVPLSNDTYFATLAASIGSDRAKIITTSPEYALPPISNSSSYGAGGDGFRETYDRAGTDGIWRCPNRDIAASWSKNGGKVYLGEWTKGVTYSDNAHTGGYCTSRGRVCHEDDIFPTFGNAPSPSAGTSQFEDEILGYWTSFIINLDPNPSGPKRDCGNEVNPNSNSFNHWWSSWWSKRSSSWTEYRSQADVLALGGNGAVGLCPQGYWGKKVKYDWQLYG